MIHSELIENVYGNIHRLILGDKMNASISKVSPSPAYNFRGKSQTGNIGFADFQVTEKSVPDKKDASKRVVLKAFVVLLAGIEPEYRSKGHFGMLMKLCEQLAQKFKCKCIVWDCIKNKDVKVWAEKNGYLLYDLNAVKYLN